MPSRPHCRTCTCDPTRERAERDEHARREAGEALVRLVASGVDTLRGLALGLAGGREPSRAELEWLRRIAEREVRAGRLARTAQRVPGAPGRPMYVYRPA